MARRRSSNGSPQIWPGFVDALSTLLLVIIFLLVVFVLAQVILSQAISGKEQALERLNRQVAELADMLDLERQANAELRLNVAQLSSSLQESVTERDKLARQLEGMTGRAEKAESALAEAQSALSTKDEELQRRAILAESLRRDIASLRKVRKELEAKVADLAGSLKNREEEIGSLRDRTKELQAKLADEQERTQLAQKEIKQKDVRLSELQQSYEEEQKLTTRQRARVGQLSAELEALRQELARLNAALEAAESKDVKSQAKIANLGKRLNRALASKVEELQRYRSQFFGELRKVLGDRPGIQVVGDRFVFQSEVLFNSGSAELQPRGMDQLQQFAETLNQLAPRIPGDINWILQVEGHTDRVPIHTERFPSNWELSAARAISVVQFLVEQGVPPDRLAAAGYGEYQPIDPRSDEIGNRRNRRIELKLTQK